LVSGILPLGEGLEEQGFDFLPGTLLESLPEFPSFMRFRACSLDALRQVAAREDEMSWGMILSPFLRRSPITVEADGFYRLKVGVLLQVLEDLEEASVSSKRRAKSWGFLSLALPESRASLPSWT
jgi:hypothetical protein